MHRMGFSTHWITRVLLQMVDLLDNLSPLLCVSRMLFSSVLISFFLVEAMSYFSRGHILWFESLYLLLFVEEELLYAEYADEPTICTLLE